MPKNQQQFPFPDWIQFYIERNAGKVPVWQFPPIPKLERNTYLIQLNFRNHHDFQQIFIISLSLEKTTFIT